MPTGDDRLRITLLGTGTSTGVPIIGCTCRVCSSPDPRDERMRCSCLIETGALTLLIDTGPDFRRQALRFGIDRLDAALFTHAHADHVVGIDELRPFFYENKTPMPCFTQPQTAQVLRQMFPYIFIHDRYAAAPRLELRAVDGPFTVRSRYGTEDLLRVEPLEVFHGDEPILGFRIGRFAYLTDTSRIPEATFERLDGLDVLVLDALRPRPHETHFSLEEATDAARRIGAQETYFVHLTHDVLHAEAEARLPDDVHVGYDGLSFTSRLPTFEGVG